MSTTRSRVGFRGMIMLQLRLQTSPCQVPWPVPGYIGSSSPFSSHGCVIYASHAWYRGCRFAASHELEHQDILRQAHFCRSDLCSACSATFQLFRDLCNRLLPLQSQNFTGLESCICSMRLERRRCRPSAASHCFSCRSSH